MKPSNTVTPFSMSLFLLLALLLSGCKEEVFVVVEVPTPTVPDYEELLQSRDPYRRIFSLEKVDDLLVLQGDRYISHLTDRDNVTNYPTGVTTLHKMPTAPNMIAWPRGNQFHITNKRAPNSSQLAYILELQAHDAEAIIANEVLTHRSKAIFSEDNHLLIPYYHTSSPEGALQFLLTQFSLRDNGPIPSSISLESVAVISPPNPGLLYDFNGHVMQAVEGGFLFTGGPPNGNVHKLNYDGTFEEVLEGEVIQFFSYQDELFAQRLVWVTLDGELRRVTQILSAAPDGLNWRLRWTLEEQSTGTLRFHPLAEDLFCYDVQNRIMFIATEINNERIQFSAVDLAELRDYQVTDIETYRGDIYLATQSGYFRRNYAEFRDSREE